MVGIITSLEQEKSGLFSNQKYFFLHSGEKTYEIVFAFSTQCRKNEINSSTSARKQLRMCSYSIKMHVFFYSVMRLLVTREVISTVICHFSINSFYELFMSIALAICSMISLIIHVIDNEEIRSKRLHMVCNVQTQCIIEFCQKSAYALQSM